MQRNKKDIMLNLIFLSFITTIIVTVLSLAKFESVINGDNNARVAMYAVDVNATNNPVRDLNIDCAGEDNLNLSDSCSYIVTNEKDGNISEVSVLYKVKIVIEELPSGITIDVTDENNVKGNLTKTEEGYIFENEKWIFKPGFLQSNTINVTFFGENIDDATSTVISDVQVSIIAEQID